MSATALAPDRDANLLTTTDRSKGRAQRLLQLTYTNLAHVDTVSGAAPLHQNRGSGPIASGTASTLRDAKLRAGEVQLSTTTPARRFDFFAGTRWYSTL